MSARQSERQLKEEKTEKQLLRQKWVLWCCCCCYCLCFLLCLCLRLSSSSCSLLEESEYIRFSHTPWLRSLYDIGMLERELIVFVVFIIVIKNVPTRVMLSCCLRDTLHGQSDKCIGDIIITESWVDLLSVTLYHNVFSCYLWEHCPNGCW